MRKPIRIENHRLLQKLFDEGKVTRDHAERIMKFESDVMLVIATHLENLINSGYEIEQIYSVLDIISGKSSKVIAKNADKNYKKGG